MHFVRTYDTAAFAMPLERIVEGPSERRTPRFLRPVAPLCLTLMLGASLFVAERAAAQSPCGQNARVLPAIPANSPPVVHGLYFSGEACGATCTMLSYNLFSQQPWVTIISSTIFPPSSSVSTVAIGTGYSIDVTGLAPGTYCAFYSESWNAQGPPPCVPGITGSPCVNSASNVQLADQITVTAAQAVLLVDPVPDLVNGNAVKTNSQLQTPALLNKGQTVNGVAADGVAQLIIRVDTTSPGHQFQITLTNDQGSANITPNEDGSLDVPGGTSFSSGQLTVASGIADSNGMAHAFAVYRAPVDFARPTSSGFKSGTCQGVSKRDDQLACRAVSLQIQDITANTSLPTVPITIVRPPVFLVHGLWGDWKGWNNFSPLVMGKKKVDGRFHVERASYDWDIQASVNSTNPQYTASMSNAKANSMGIQYVTPFVLTQMATTVAKFKTGDNPINIPIAAVQVDVVAHSMGGVVTRTLPLLAGFFTNSFGQGMIHKVISVDVPHLGSPLAPVLLDPSADCTREILAKKGSFSFKSVTLVNAPNTSVGGAVGDMVNSPLSQPLTAISNPGPRALPTALIAGVYTNFTSLDCTTTLRFPCPAYYIRTTCGAQNDLMAAQFNSTKWQLIFGPAGNNANDAVVSQSSQWNGLTISNGTNGFVYSGLVHSPELTKLSFTGPSVLDPASAPNPVANQVITLLNTPYTQPAFQSLNP